MTKHITAFTIFHCTLPLAILYAGCSSVRSPSTIEEFSSVEGNFKIALPKDGARFRDMSSRDSPGIGGEYTWILDYGQIVLRYFDVEETGYVFDDYKMGVLGTLRATEISETNIALGEHKGREYRFNLPDGSRRLMRVFIVGKRVYTLTAQGVDTPGAANRISAAFDTFSLITPVPFESEFKKPVVKPPIPKQQKP